MDGEPTVAPDASTGSGLDAIRTLLGSRPEPVPRYLLGDTLGRGGMGEVFSAYDARLRRTIALKALRHRDPAEEIVARFLREAQVTGQLEHPNVVPVYDIGLDAEGRVFYTMKKVQGRSLAQLVRDRKGGRVARLRIFLQICEAVAYAHDRGVVHRDLKPANVMLGEFGEVLVLDWGIAKRVGEAVERPVHSGAGAESLSDLTRADVVMGTPSWMSPEQARGEAAHPSADQYALGAILYLLLTGHPPFKPGPGVLDAVRAGSFPRPRAIARDVPRELEAVVLQAMALQREDRYTAVTAMRDDISSFLEGRPVAAMRYTLWDRVSRWSARNWRPVVIATGVAFGIGATGLAGLTLAAGVWSWSANNARDVAISSEKSATRQLAETRVALALVDVEAGRPQGAAMKLDEARAAWAGLGEADPPLLALARSYLAWRADSPPIAWTGGELGIADVSEDGRDVVVADAAGAFWWLDGVTGRVLVEVRPEGAIEATGVALAAGSTVIGWVDAAPDRRQHFAVLGRDGSLTEETVLPLPPATRDGDAALLSADGTLALLVDDRARLFALPGGAPVGAGVDGVWVIGASADLSRVVGRRRDLGSFLRASVDLGVWDVRTGQPVWYLRERATGTLSDDGSLLAVISGDPRMLRLISLATGEVLWEVPDDEAGDALFVPGGEALAVYSEERAWLRALDTGRDRGRLPYRFGAGTRFGSGGYLTTAAGGNLTIRPWRSDRPDRALAQIPGGVRALDLSTDGHLVAFAGSDGQVQVMDADGGAVLRELVGNPCPRDDGLCGSRDVAFDEAGGRVAVADRDGAIRVWDLATGRIAWATDAGLGIVGALDWLGDQLVSVHENGTLVAWDPATGVERRRYHEGLTSSWLVALHPDGRRAIATGRGTADPQIEVWDLTTGRRLAIADQKGPCYRGALSPDGRSFAVGTPSNGVWLWDLTTDVLTGRLLVDTEETVLSVGWTTNGATVLVGWLSGRVSVVDVARGTELVSLPLHRLGAVGTVQDIAVRADDRMLTVGDDGRLVGFDLALRGEGGWEVPLGSTPGAPEWLRGARMAERWGDWRRALALYDAAAGAGAPVAATDRARALRELGRTGEVDALRSAVLAEGMTAEVFAVWSGH